ncbi:MAG: sulfite reductase [Chloroflexi bacterium]|nr:MAG: sulfite reductase [Chloroflexota bacterium]RLC97320.1 MAG: sulfite reductase [Chloroflexota bacterium]
MSDYISRADLLSWLEKVSQSRDLVAPVKIEDLTLFQKVERVEDIVFDPGNTDLSPKEFFFPKSEVLFYVDRSDGRVELVPAEVEQETVIFGIRPCDAKGIAVLDLPYLEEPADALYRQHREKTTLVGLSCVSACPECFCTSMGTTPDDASNVDIMLTEVEEGFIVQVVTEKGKALLPEGLLSSKEVSPPAAPSVASVPSEGIAEKMHQVFDSPYWDRLADRCLHCNVCSYVCPTCYCFDVRDLRSGGRVERVRSWESCQSPGFTKIAGGYDPRAAKGPRLRQRFAHKLLYFVEKFGVTHCVGCGRCVRSCPVNIDIREVIQDVQGLGVKSEA